MNCPICGSNKLTRGSDNMFCTQCGFFPIEYTKNKKLYECCMCGKTTTDIFNWNFNKIKGSYECPGCLK